ncbi:MAG: hypothetical protein JNJ84_06875, partial [Rhodobacteraceae bacterium]|nr:hypothetical protein [Paracoccaceae bacterium]
LARVAGTPRRADWQALILHATEGSAVHFGGGDYPTRCLMLLPDDPAFLTLYATELVRSLSDDPGLWDACPSPETLMARIDQVADSAAEMPLRDLLALTMDLAPRE